MANRITRKMIDEAFDSFDRAVPSGENCVWILDTDGEYYGLRLHRIDVHPGWRTSSVKYQLGKSREAFTRLHAMIDCAEHLAQLQKGD